jgi:ribonuclease VapC
VFLDASAIVAMMTDEVDAVLLAPCLDRAETRLTSPMAIYETTAALARLKGRDVADAARVVTEFLNRQKITVVAIAPEMASLAIEAFARFGKGQGHPAQLNMGDCFAYACARHLGVPLLYKGDNFARTDIESAMD